MEVFREQRKGGIRGQGAREGCTGRPDQPLTHWGMNLSGGQQEVQAGVQDINISGLFAPLSPLKPFPCED